MKKKNIVFALSCFLLALACSKSSDDTPEEEPPSIDKTANLLSTGDSANDLLSNDKFTKLKIEIAFVNDFRPTQSAMNGFVDYIKQHTFKQNVELVFNALESPNQETLTLQEIAKLESENRTVYNDGDTLGVYIYFADAPDDSDDEEEGLFTVGSVYRNTSMIIYESTVRRVAGSSPLITNADVESTTVNHEFGHLFGLVDLGSPPVNNHEDPEAVSHCIVEGCLMQAKLQFGESSKSTFVVRNSVIANGLKSGCTLTGKSVLKMLQSTSAKGQVTAPELDPQCILDLQANGGR